MERRRFPTTQWSLVERAGQTVSGNPALEELLRRYLPALRAHLCHVKRMNEDEAENLLQSFILDKVIQQKLIARADRQKGRFRTFLLTVLDNYVRTAHRRAQSASRRADAASHSLEGITGEAESQMRPSRSFDVIWARTVLDQALQCMEARCRDQGNDTAWAVFHSRLVSPLLHGQVQESYADLVDRLNLRTATEAHNALVTAKRMFRRALNEVIGEYARDQAEIDSEIRDLYAVLEAAAQDRGRNGVTTW